MHMGKGFLCGTSNSPLTPNYFSWWERYTFKILTPTISCQLLKHTHKVPIFNKLSCVSAISFSQYNSIFSILNLCRISIVQVFMVLQRNQPAGYREHVVKTRADNCNLFIGSHPKHYIYKNKFGYKILHFFQNDYLLPVISATTPQGYINCHTSSF